MVVGLWPFVYLLEVYRLIVIFSHFSYEAYRLGRMRHPLSYPRILEGSFMSLTIRVVIRILFRIYPRLNFVSNTIRSRHVPCTNP